MKDLFGNLIEFVKKYGGEEIRKEIQNLDNNNPIDD